MNKTQTDGVGQEIRVGDILLSASKTGNIKIGRVERIFDSGHISIKLAEKKNVYAYERGAAGIPTEASRIKRDENGEAIYEDDPRGRRDWRGNVWRRPVYEKYTYEANDYTVVDKVWYWKTEEAAHYARFVVKSTADHPLFSLNQYLDLNYDEDTPNMG